MRRDRAVLRDGREQSKLVTDQDQRRGGGRAEVAKYFFDEAGLADSRVIALRHETISCCARGCVGLEWVTARRLLARLRPSEFQSGFDEGLRMIPAEGFIRIKRADSFGKTRPEKPVPHEPRNPFYSVGVTSFR